MEEICGSQQGKRRWQMEVGGATVSHNKSGTSDPPRGRQGRVAITKAAIWLWLVHSKLCGCHKDIYPSKQSCVKSITYNIR